MGTVNATARGENDTTKEATLMDMASVTAMAGVHSKGMERLREVCEERGIELSVDDSMPKDTIFYLKKFGILLCSPDMSQRTFESILHDLR